MWELDHKEGWVPKKWCFRIVVLEKTLESFLDSEEIQPVNPKGNQPWIFIGRTDADAETPILWPSDTESQLIGDNPDAGKDWGQEEKGPMEDEMVPIKITPGSFKFIQMIYFHTCKGEKRFFKASI